VRTNRWKTNHSVAQPQPNQPQIFADERRSEPV
jgi:hypothetical protein